VTLLFDNQIAATVVILSSGGFALSGGCLEITARKRLGAEGEPINRLAYMTWLRISIWYPSTIERSLRTRQSPITTRLFVAILIAPSVLVLIAFVSLRAVP
jgi:hypothetical protein